MEPLHPLNQIKVHKTAATTHRSHALIHSIALFFMIYYRFSSLLHHFNINTQLQTQPILPIKLMIFFSELLFSFLWLLYQAYQWNPISRTVFPERLPENKELPAIDVFVCTADPKKEPPSEVMNTVLAAMAMDYPPEKVVVYVSDDGGSDITLCAVREAWNFGRLWIPFCRKYGIKTRSPGGYFSTLGYGNGGGVDFIRERDNIEKKHEEFKECLRQAEENCGIRDTNVITGQSHSPVIEVIGDDTDNEGHSRQHELPILVYISREKKSSLPHHFKAGALNVLLRVSGVISNAPYILLLDCDMYPNDPSSARQSMCFHLDSHVSASLAFVQFPQKFHNLSNNDIYDSQLRSVFMVRYPGMDGLKGPMMSGTCFYIKREALYGSDLQKDTDLLKLKDFYGPSSEFINSLSSGYKQYAVENEDSSNTLLKETQVLASCTYEKDTKWGQQIGFLYNSMLEDFFTGFTLHCKGWKSVYYNPLRPAFLGTATTSLNDNLVQGTRWNSGLLEVSFSKFCPLFYRLSSRMSLLQRMCYGFLAFQPLYFFSVWCLATIPQLCLFYGIPVYPKVSSSWSIVFLFVFLSSLLKQLWDVLSTGGSIQTWWNEWRVWMIRSVTVYFYASLNTFLKWVGMRKSSFTPTNKVSNEEQVKLYQMGMFNFQTSSMFLAPLATIVILNMVSFIGGIARATLTERWEDLFGQIFLSFFILIVSYPVIEGMILRKDKGRIPPAVTLFSAFFSLIFLYFGQFVLMLKK